MLNLRYFKLVNGDSVIALQQAFIIGQGYKVRSPMNIYIFNSPTEEGQAKVFLNRWVPFSDDVEYVIAANHVITSATVDAEMTKYYIQAIQTEREYLEEQTRLLLEEGLDVDFTPDSEADCREDLIQNPQNKEDVHPLIRRMDIKNKGKKIKAN